MDFRGANRVAVTHGHQAWGVDQETQTPAISRAKESPTRKGGDTVSWIEVPVITGRVIEHVAPSDSRESAYHDANPS